MGSLNIINDARNKFNELVSKIKNTDNILQYYDNTTYNIRFYMINSYAQQMISKLREMGQIDANYNIENNEKIIIAETGKSSKVSIDSLTLKTIHANSCSSHSATTYQLEMIIKEINGCQLVNQIAAVSKLLGYDNYILQPFHIDIWFSGYNNETHLPCQIIPEIGVLTYEVILNEVKTNVDLTGTTYNFICTNAGIGSVTKDVIVMTDKGHFYTTDGMTLEKFRNDLEDALNKDYFEKNKNHEQYFKEHKYIHIRLIDIDNDINLSSQKPSDYISQTLRYEKLAENMYPENNDTTNESGIKPSQRTSLSTIFQEFCLNSNNLLSYTAKPLYKVQQIANIDGVEINEIFVDVLFQKNNYLDHFNKRFENGLKSNSTKDLLDAEYTSAYLYLQSIIVKGLLNRKYEWLFNGKDTNVLEMNSSIDKLWYANIPLYDLIDNYKNQSNEYMKLLGNVQVNKLLTANFSSMTKEKMYEEIKKAIQNTNKPLNSIRAMSSDKHLYIDDIYHCLSQKTKNEYLNDRIILEKVDPYSATMPTKESMSTDPIIIAKTGYHNLYNAGNLIELQFKILGDPYWLELCSDKCIYNKSYQSIGNMQYFVFKMNTCADQKPDGTYDLENVVDFTNIYQIIESTSIFESGRFIQNIKAIIAPEFLTLGRLEI